MAQGCRRIGRAVQAIGAGPTVALAQAVTTTTCGWEAAVPSKKS